MAEVRAGTDLRLKRPVAVKLLLPEMAARDDIRRRFEAEARASASFNDPHAVAVFDTGEHEGQPYIVMERLPGETLADRIRAGPADPAWLALVAREVLGALGAAHAAGLVHRDVKPGNILITADDHAKIADFGIAKSLDEAPGTVDLTGTGQLLGTPAYLSPDRLEGGPATAQSDLYALGVVLYEGLTGRCPFPGDTPLAIARAVVAGQHQPLDEARPGLDPALVAVVERAMAADPEERYPSAAAMAAALAPAAPSTAGGTGEPTLLNARLGPATEILDRRDLTIAAPVPMAAAPGTLARPRFRAPLAILLGIILLAALIGSFRSRSSADRTANPAAQSTTPTTTLSLSAKLRAAAGRLGPADGARAADLATSLRSVADAVDAGGGGGGAQATGAMAAIGAWRLTGQLSDAAASSTIDLLSQVPGATILDAPLAPTRPVPTAPATTKARGKAKGKD